MKTTAKILPCNEVNFDKKYRTIQYIYLDGHLEGVADVPILSEEVSDDSLVNIMNSLEDEQTAEVELIVTVKNKPIKSLAIIWKPDGFKARGLVCASDDFDAIEIARKKKESLSRYL